MHLLSRILCSCLVLVAFATSVVFAASTDAKASAPAIWDGSVDTTWFKKDSKGFVLTTAEQLAGLAHLVNNGTSNFKGVTISIGADIFLNDTTGAGERRFCPSNTTITSLKRWTPIGNFDKQFAGKIDGAANADATKRHKIYGMFIHEPGCNSVSKSTIKCGFKGFVGFSDTASISNLEIPVGCVLGDSSSFFGSFVGYSYAGELSNVHSGVELVAGRSNIGGLIGYTTGNIVSSSFDGSVTGYYEVGGLVGALYGRLRGSQNAKNSVKGSVSASTDVGGAAGFVSGSVSNVVVSAKVSGESPTGGVVGYMKGKMDSVSYEGLSVSGTYTVGGLVGDLVGGPLLNSSFKGNLHASGNYVGGLVGDFIATSKETFADSVVYNCFSSGTIDGKGSDVGGLVGYFEALYNEGDKLHHNHFSIVDSYSDADVSGGSSVGGIVGRLEKSLTKNPSEYTAEDSLKLDSMLVRIKSCHHKGNVKGSGDVVGGVAGYAEARLDSVYQDMGSITGVDSVGGIVGVSYGLITNVWVTAGAWVDGVDFVGGIAGIAGGDMHFVRFEGGEVNATGSYIGGVAGIAYKGIDSAWVSTKVTGNAYAGGIASQVNGKIYRADVEGIVKGAYQTGGIVGKAIDSVVRCKFNGYVNGTTQVGGIVGEAEGLVDSVVHVGGDVVGVHYVGGLVGSLKGSLMNSSSEGNVVANNVYAGGAVGVHTAPAQTTIFNVTSKGSVSSPTFAGGIVGYSDGVIDSVTHSGGTVEGSLYTGGIAGMIYGGMISAARSYGDVHGTTNFTGGVVGFLMHNDSLHGVTYERLESVGDVSGNVRVGGIVGVSMKGAVDANSVKFVDVVIKDCNAQGRVSGRDSVGGIVGALSISIGENASAANRIRSNIKDCVHEGEVVATDNYAGGIVGATYGDVTNSMQKGVVKGFAYVGGIAGNASRIDSTSAVDSVYGTHNVGGIAGYANVIRHSSYTGAVVASGEYVGGIAGKSLDSIIDCHSRANVFGEAYVGGAAGESKYLLNSDAEGDVNGSSGYLGGLVGFSEGVENSYAKGNVVGSTANSHGVGGVAGFANSLKNVHHEGGVTGASYVGGVVGNASWNSGKMLKSYAAAGSIRGENFVGGLVGYGCKMALDSSYFVGDSVVGTTAVGGAAGCSESVKYSYSMAAVRGVDSVGGLVGVTNNFITYSFATGNVSGEKSVGGLVGEMYMDAVSLSYASGDVTGTSNVGGLFGKASGSFDKTYASGKVVANSDTSVSVGCLVGNTQQTIEINSSYFDNEKCDGLNLSGTGVDNVTLTNGSSGLSTTAMKTESSFNLWDFTQDWKISAGTYPYLLFYDFVFDNVIVATESLDGFVYSGNAVEPEVTSVTLSGKTLEKGADYTVSYSSNVDAGVASINVCGMGSYNSCKNVYFEIAAKEAVPTVQIQGAEYSGYEVRPKARVFVENVELDASNYTAEYLNNINAGTASVTVTLKRNYKGKKTEEFEIAKATPVISIKPTATALMEGDKLRNSAIEGDSVGIEGEFAWADSSIVVDAGLGRYEAIFIPDDLDNYNVLTGVMLDVLVYRSYTVTFLNYDGSELVSYTIAEGDMPRCSVPALKDSTKNYAYTFESWSPVVVRASEDAVYTATFSRTLIGSSSSVVVGSSSSSSNKGASSSSGKGAGSSGSAGSSSGNASSSSKVVVGSSDSRSESSSSFVVDTLMCYHYWGVCKEIGKYCEEFWKCCEESGMCYEISGLSCDKDGLCCNANGSCFYRDEDNLFVKKSSSSGQSKSSSSKKPVSGVKSSSSRKAFNISLAADAISPVALAPTFKAYANGLDIMVTGAKIGERYTLLDAQGRVLRGAVVERKDFVLHTFHAGIYLLRIGSRTQQVTLR